MTLTTLAPTTRAASLESIGQSIKDSAIWLGRKISYCFNTYVVPAANKVIAFLRTGHGVAGIGILVGITLLSLSNRHSTFTWRYGIKTRILLKVLAIMCFVGAGAALTVGPATLI